MFNLDAVDDGFWVAARHRQVVILAGAGVSSNPPSALPGWLALNDAIAGVLADRVGSAVGKTAWTTSVADLLATRRRTGAFPPEYQAQILEEVCGLTYFDALTTLDVTQYNQAHDGIAALAQAGALRAIVTTNFDRLIERALDNRGIPYVSVYDDSGFSSTASALARREDRALPVIHVHGSVVDASSLVDTLKQRKLGRSRLLTDLMEALGEAYWLYLGFSGADLLGDPEYLGLRAAARRAIGGTFVRYPGSGLDPPALNAGAQSLVDAFEEPASIPIAHLGDILTTMTHQLGVPSPKASSGSGTGGEDVVIKLKDWAHTLDTPAAAVCLAGLLEANSQPELAVRLLDHIVRKEEHLRESPSFPLAAINYGRLGQAWGRFVHVPDLNGAQSNASVESLQSLLRLAGTPYEYQASIWASCAMLWNGDGATAISSARALVAALVSKDSTEKPEDLVDSWLAAAQIAFITLDAGLFEGCITNVGIARKCAGLSGDVVRAARVGAIELLLHSVTTNGVDVEELAQQRSEELAEARRVGDRLTLGFRQLAFGRWLTGAGRRSAILPDNAVEIANKALRELGDARETLRSLNLDPWVCVADLQAVKALGDLCAADQNPEHRDALVDETQILINGILNSGAADRFRILEPQIWEVAGQIGRQFGAAGAADFFRRAVMTAERTGQLNRAVLASRDLANAAAVP